jgi:hypothetical protein
MNTFSNIKFHIPRPAISEWTLDEGIKVARRAEAALKKVCYHVALGGSVLHSGRSTHDLDLFVYPHKHPQPEVVKDALERCGFEYILDTAESKSEYVMFRRILKFAYDSKPVDVFILGDQ